MLVIPFGNDQPRVAHQIADLHLGKYLKRKILTPSILKDNAKKILQDTSYKENIIPFQQKSQAAGGNAAIAKMVLSELCRIEEKHET